MSVLSATTQQQVEDDLVKDGTLTAAQLADAKAKAKANDSSVFGTLVSLKLITNEQLTKAIAEVTKVPYVNLSTAAVDPKVLDLLSQDIAERYMAVPLGEMQHRLVVAMLDADNVQAVDFLSKKIARPLKVYVASEEGIKNVLKQYQGHLSEDVTGQISQFEKDVAAEVSGDKEHQAQKDGQPKDKNIKTLVQD